MIKKSIVEDLFKQIDEKFKCLNDESKEWIKVQIMTHIQEAYTRGQKTQEIVESNKRILKKL